MIVVVGRGKRRRAAGAVDRPQAIQQAPESIDQRWDWSRETRMEEESQNDQGKWELHRCSSLQGGREQGELLC